MIDINDRITQLRDERNWTEYQLAEKSGITQSTISSWSRINSVPTIINLDKICKAFGITLSQFFADSTEEKVTYLTDTQKEMLQNYIRLTPEQQESLLQFLKKL